MAASLAQLTAGDAHSDAEIARVHTSIDFALVERDIARLADLAPGEEARKLAADIRRRLSAGSSS